MARTLMSQGRPSAPLLLMLLLAAAVATTRVQAADGCFEPDAVGFRIPPVVVPGYGMCPRGFYCPNSDVANTSTYPVFCKPSTECLQRRIHFEYCEPQGLFEPTVCPEGYYCPTGREKRKCPSGYRCPYGTVTPRKCGGLSLCPEGCNTELFLGVLLVLALVDGLIVAGYLALRRYFAQPSKLDPLVAHMDPAEASDYAATLVRKALGTAEPVSVVFDDLRVTLPAGHKTAPNKQLLQGVSGTLKAGEVTAIMGPSGAGKTVLFTTILGKQPAEWCVDGDLRVCGAHKFTDFPECVGFVPQDDVLRSELTIHENVKYTTDIRLPASWTSEDRLAMRTAVLRALGVDHVRDVTIGDEEQRGVSGGQRKRCSVACELAAAPAAIFLDEPTTGLDAHTSLELVRTLKVIARKARIPVAMVVHQPRVEIWEELDAVLLLAPGGRTVYSGTREGAESYLQAYAPEADFSVGNPCDTAMDVITARGAPLADAWTQASQEAALAAGSAAARPEDTNPQEIGTVDPPRREIAGRLRQFALAHWRQLVIQYRTAHVFLLDVLLCMIGGVLLTSAAIDSPFVGQLQGLYIAVSPRTNIQNVSMLCMLWGIAFAAGLGPAGVRVLTKGRPSYWREAAAGHSRLAFYLGATSAELYRVTVTMLHFSAVVYLMWQPNMSFGLVFGFLLLYGFCHDSQAVMLGSFVDPFIAPLLATVIGVFTSLLNGFPQIPAVSPFSYSWAVTELFYKAEIHDVGHVFRTDTLEDNFGYDFERPGYDYGIAFGEAMLFRLLAFVFVIALNRDKQR